MILFFSLTVMAQEDFYSKSEHYNVNIADPYEQWIYWETNANVPAFRKHTNKVKLKYVLVHISEVDIDATHGISNTILKNLIEGEFIRFPLNPYNQNTTLTPWAHRKKKGALEAHLTASRSMALKTQDEGKVFSLKLPTDHIYQPPKRQALARNKNLLNYVRDQLKQQGKDDLTLSVIISRQRSELIQQIDQERGIDSEFEVLQDVLSVRMKEGGNGFTVRDLTPMKKAYYYLPGHSVPTAGRDIAQNLNLDFDHFFTEHYLKPVARAKAKLLSRYGLQMYQPNPQNFLIELSPERIPTGRVLIRDISDSRFVDFVAESIHPLTAKALEFDREKGFTVDNKLQPHYLDAIYKFNDQKVSSQILIPAGHAHDAAYAEALGREGFFDKDIEHFKDLSAASLTRSYNRGHSPLVNEAERLVRKSEILSNKSFNLDAYPSEASRFTQSHSWVSSCKSLF